MKTLPVWLFVCAVVITSYADNMTTENSIVDDQTRLELAEAIGKQSQMHARQGLHLSHTDRRDLIKRKRHASQWSLSTSRERPHSSRVVVKPGKRRSSLTSAALSRYEALINRSKNFPSAKFQTSTRHRSLDHNNLADLPHIRPQIKFGKLHNVKQLRVSDGRLQALATSNTQTPYKSRIRSTVESTGGKPYHTRIRRPVPRVNNFIKVKELYRRRPIGLRAAGQLSPVGAGFPRSVGGPVSLRTSKYLGAQFPYRKIKRPSHYHLKPALHHSTDIPIDASILETLDSGKNKLYSSEGLAKSPTGHGLMTPQSTDLSLSASLRQILPNPPSSTILHIEQIPFSEGIKHRAPHKVSLSVSVDGPAINDQDFGELGATGIIQPHFSPTDHDTSFISDQSSDGVDSDHVDGFITEDARTEETHKPIINSDSTLYYAGTHSLHGKHRNKPLATHTDSAPYDNLDLKGLLQRYVAKQQQLLSLSDDSKYENHHSNSAEYGGVLPSNADAESSQFSDEHKSVELSGESMPLWESLKQHFKNKYESPAHSHHTSKDLLKFKYAGALHENHGKAMYVYEDHNSNQLLVPCLHCAEHHASEQPLSHSLKLDEDLVEDMPISIDDVKTHHAISHDNTMRDSLHYISSLDKTNSNKNKDFFTYFEEPVSFSDHIDTHSGGSLLNAFEYDHTKPRSHKHSSIFPLALQDANSAEKLTTHETRIFRPSQVFNPPPIMYGGFKPIIRGHKLKGFSLYSRRKRGNLEHDGSLPIMRISPLRWRRQRRAAVVAASPKRVMMRFRHQPSDSTLKSVSDDEQYRILADVHHTMRHSVDMVEITANNGTAESDLNLEDANDVPIITSNQTTGNSSIETTTPISEEEGNSSAEEPLPESETEMEKIEVDVKINEHQQSPNTNKLRQHTIELLKQLKESGSIPNTTEFKPHSNVNSLIGYLIPKNGDSVQPLNHASRIIIRNAGSEARAMPRFGDRKHSRRGIAHKMQQLSSGLEPRHSKGKNASTDNHKEEKLVTSTESALNSSATENENEEDDEADKEKTEEDDDVEEEIEDEEENNEKENLLADGGHGNVLFPLDPHRPHAYRPEHYYRPYRESVILQMLRRVVRGFNRLFFGPHYANHIEYEGLYGVHRRRRGMIG